MEALEVVTAQFESHAHADRMLLVNARKGRLSTRIS